MFRKLMLAGLIGATMLSGIAPAYAQHEDGERRGRPGGWNGGGQPQAQMQRRDDNGGGRGDRGERRGDNGVPVARPQPQAQPPVQARLQTPNAQGQGWRQRADRAPVTPVPPDRDGRNRPQVRGDNRPAWQNGPNQQRQNWQDNRRDGRQDGRQDWRNVRRDGRQDWAQGRTDQGRNDWRDGNRRFDDRSRWTTQRRWDNGWRQDRRYDWQNYRARYGDRYRAGRYYAPRGWNYGYRRFSIGIVLSSLLYSNNYWIDDPYDYRLPPAYGTLRWVRYYDDAVLVDVRDGYVVDVIHDFFW